MVVLLFPGQSVRVCRMLTFAKDYVLIGMYQSRLLRMFESLNVSVSSVHAGKIRIQLIV